MNRSPPAQWRLLMRENFTDWKKLAHFLTLTEEQCNTILQHPKFALNLPMRLARKIKKGDLNDPILRQFIATKEETLTSPIFLQDPVGDGACRKASKFLQKYEGRVLLLCTSACAMHCRYCFRQNFDYATEKKEFNEELHLIQNDPSIHEVILSGGDPLSLSDDSLSSLLQNIDAIPHIKRIRFHTRFPIGIPERIDEDFIKLLKKVKAQIWFVIHANHPKELDQEVLERLQSLQKIGVVLLNQSVLLKGVNDDAETLYQLCQRLIDHGILPYYLHQLDRVQGAMHFEVEEEKGNAIIKALTARLPGYGVPKYVKEIAGQTSKTTISP